MSDKNRIPRSDEDDFSREIVEQRQRFIEEQTGAQLDHTKQFSFDPSEMESNIENFWGVAQIPIGVAGPLLVNGEHAQGEFYVPMATVETAVAAPMQRQATGGVIGMASNGTPLTAQLIKKTIYRSHPSDKLGLSFEPIQLPGASPCLRIASVAPYSICDRGGLRTGDFIFSLNGIPTPTLGAIMDAGNGATQLDFMVQQTTVAQVVAAAPQRRGKHWRASWRLRAACAVNRR